MTTSSLAMPCDTSVGNGAESCLWDSLSLSENTKSIMVCPTSQPITQTQMEISVEATCRGAHGGEVALPDSSANARDVRATLTEDNATE